MENGLYGYSNEFFAVVFDDEAQAYDIGWYGDLAAFEITKHDGLIDVSGCSSPADLIQTVFNLRWTPEEEDVFFFGQDDFPFDDYPEVHPEGRKQNLVERDSGMPFLDWLFDEYSFLD